MMNRRKRVIQSDFFDPDEIFLDSVNLPEFDQDQMEGKIEHRLGLGSYVIVGGIFVVILFGFLFRLYNLQIANGESYANRSEANHLEEVVVFPNRGVIYDRNGALLASNSVNSQSQDFAKRSYDVPEGLAHVIGYVSYPLRDKLGRYFNLEYKGVVGVEASFNDTLAGSTGKEISERDATGKVTSSHLLEPAKDGNSVHLSLDASVTNALYNSIKSLSNRIGFSGGAGILMDVNTGEVVALTSYPEFDSQKMVDRDSLAIKSYNDDSKKPFLNRATGGLYTPGSIVKPFMAAAALEEGIIDPQKKILSTGSISIPNPYAPEKKSIFMDWKAHGWVNMAEAIANSSNVYFYAIGGGFEDQKGLGIGKIEQHMKSFGFGTGNWSPEFKNAKAGTIPSPKWKAENFNGDGWRLGDTYHTSIGQYGFLITPLEMVRGIAMIANGGTLNSPSLVLGGNRSPSTVPINPANLVESRKGMRMGVLQGTLKGLNVPYVSIAGKTGTAELDAGKKYVNSWSVGFFPYEKPRFAYTVVMEKGSRENTIGATMVVREFFDWLHLNKPEYLKPVSSDSGTSSTPISSTSTPSTAVIPTFLP